MRLNICVDTMSDNTELGDNMIIHIVVVTVMTMGSDIMPYINPLLQHAKSVQLQEPQRQ